MGTTYRELFKLYDLIQSGDVRSVEQFISNNETLNINEILPCKGIGVLHLAVGIEPLEKSKECTELILKLGGDPNLCNDDGVTPVHIAAIWGRVDNLKILIGCGGDPSRRDFDGHSAFDYAAKEKQWDVYDYLHNVVDQLDDSLGSPCAYSLDLERILVTTDHMVAEYEPIAYNPTWTPTMCRKSEMVRDWCEKSSLVMNKLYPTILSETFLIENDSAPWRSINLTKNMTFDLTTDIKQCDLNETNNTYMTCLSKRITPNVEISGIQQLEITSHDSKDSSNDNQSTKSKQRFSVYENFSLPGSPNSITHRNYNSKSTVKKNQSNDTSSSELKRLTFDTPQSLLTEDCTQVFDKALAVAQNRTNEWISSSSSDCQISDIKACNTRRSSASSGVSSNFSGGSIVIANIHEEYKYEDKEENVVLIEKRLLVSSVVLPVEESADTSPDQTILSVASSLPPSMEYDNNTLRQELQLLGFNPGPIQDSNKTLYLKKLQSLKRNPIVVKNQGKMARQNASHEQLEKLVEYMEEHRDLATDSKVQTTRKNRNPGSWPELAAILNSCPGGVTKRGVEWRIYWKDIKNKVEKKSIENNQASGSSGPFSRRLELSALDERVLAIFHNESTPLAPAQLTGTPMAPTATRRRAAATSSVLDIDSNQPPPRRRRYNADDTAYSVELEKSLRNDDWMKNLSPYIELENKARADFGDPNKKWREGAAKTSFTYLLLDPRLTVNLPAKAGRQSQHESWTTFVNSIFYVGKGKRSRPYSHLYQALTLWKRDFTRSNDKKVQHILDIWSDKVGVICLHIFQNVIPAEAYTYEAAMIDILGVQNLKNLKVGNYYGAVSSWPLKDRRMLGLYLLYKAMLIFLSEGERQLRPDDID